MEKPRLAWAEKQVGRKKIEALLLPLQTTTTTKHCRKCTYIGLKENEIILNKSEISSEFKLHLE